MLRMPMQVRRCCLGGALALLVVTGVQAAERRFMPVPVPPSQRIDVINGLPILSGAAKHFDAGTSLSATGARQARLMVSFKNQGKQPASLGPAAVVASTAGQVLALREIGADGKPGDSSAGKALLPGEVFATQYLLELPRKQRGQLAALTVTVELGGERQVFEFKEVE